MIFQKNKRNKVFEVCLLFVFCITANSINAGVDKTFNEVNSVNLNAIDAAIYSSNDKIYFFENSKYIRYDAENEKVDEGYPAPINLHWKGFPLEFHNNFDAAIMHENGKIYIFKGDKYVRYTPGKGMDKGYPMPITKHWKGLPKEFQSDFDAAIMLSNGKVYFFKGSNYVRYTPGKGMDKGYPKSIKQHWAGLPKEFHSNLDAAIMHDNGRAYFFKGDKYVRFNVSTDSMDKGYPKKISDHWNGVFNETEYTARPLTVIESATAKIESNNIYFFGGSDYSRFNVENNKVDSGYHRTITGNWKGIPDDLHHGVDAAYTYNGETFFFKGNGYVQYIPGKGFYTTDLWRLDFDEQWQGLPEEFIRGIDAAVYIDEKDKLYFFKGSEYLRLSRLSGSTNNRFRVDPNYPKPIAGNWPGFPQNFTNGIDAALRHPTNGKIYFFKESKYIRYTPEKGVDENYPKLIEGHWPNLYSLDKRIIELSANINTDNVYSIRAKHSNKVLDVPAASVNEDEKVTQYTKNSELHQIWKFNRLGDGSYEIINVNSGLLLTRSDNDQYIRQNYSNARNTQKFKMLTIGNSYALLDVTSKKALSIANESNQNGAKLVLSDFDISDIKDNQLFKFDIAPRNFSHSLKLKKIECIKPATGIELEFTETLFHVASTVGDVTTGTILIPQQDMKDIVETGLAIKSVVDNVGSIVSPPAIVSKLTIASTIADLTIQSVELGSQIALLIDEDRAPDHLYIKVNGKKKWPVNRNYKNVDAGDSHLVNLTITDAIIDFKRYRHNDGPNKFTLEFFDRDNPSKDDSFGRLELDLKPWRKKETFTSWYECAEEDVAYLLTFSVE